MNLRSTILQFALTAVVVGSGCGSEKKPNQICTRVNCAPGTHPTPDSCSGCLPDSADAGVDGGMSKGSDSSNPTDSQ